MRKGAGWLGPSDEFYRPNVEMKDPLERSKVFVSGSLKGPIREGLECRFVIKLAWNSLRVDDMGEMATNQFWASVASGTPPHGACIMRWSILFWEHYLAAWRNRPPCLELWRGLNPSIPPVSHTVRQFVWIGLWRGRCGSGLHLVQHRFVIDRYSRAFLVPFACCGFRERFKRTFCRARQPNRALAVTANPRKLRVHGHGIFEAARIVEEFFYPQVWFGAEAFECR